MNAAIPTTDTAGSLTAAAGAYVEVHETHTGVVLLVGERAYKAKKPVLTDFLDFRTPELRERACRREVALNSRLSAGTYLGIAHLEDPAGGPPEPFVVMRRYRDRDRLAAMVTRGRTGEDDESVRGMLDTIAAVLARFHERAERSSTIDTQGSADAVNRRWMENLQELQRYAGATFSEESLARIQRLFTDFVSGRAPLFAHRIAQGCIVDGHGDLLADDIFWVDGEPAILDCLEFDDELRYVDRIDDAAFLAMDLEFLGRKDLGDYFLERYAARSTQSGASSPAPASLRDFYVAYRALVRAKVDCVRLSQGAAEAGMDAACHLAIATWHLEDGGVRLALIGGNPGTGKSTLAAALAEHVGAQVISTDDVRRQLRDGGAIAGEAGVLDAGLYSPENVMTVYEVALRRAGQCLANGQSVILDGTWRDPHLRALAHRLASETHSALVELMCAVPVDAAAGRITTREPGSSDATPEIAAALAARHHGWDTAHLLETNRPFENSIREARDIWRRANWKE